MAKDTFWFKHDYHARSDKEMMRLRMKMGMRGVGLYWCIIEMLYEEDGYLLRSECERIAFELQSQCDEIKSVIEDFNLFKKDGEKFWSDSLILRLNHKKDKSVKASESAEKRWSDANAMRTHSEGNAIRGEEKRIDNNKNTPERGAQPPPPSLDLVCFFEEKDFNGLPQTKCDDVIRLVKVVKKIDVEKEDIETLWGIFKNQNLTGAKPYNGKEDVYRHFLNWAKGHAFKKGAQPRKQQKSDEKILGVEYLNDFSQCKMSDGSVQQLDENQRSMAKFQGIKPNVIVKK